jgi:hypothetical protein
MKLFIGSTQFNVPDENVRFYNELGVVESDLNLTKNKKFDKIIPDNPNNFKVFSFGDVKHWRNDKYIISNLDKNIEDKKEIGVGNKCYNNFDYDKFKNIDRNKLVKIDDLTILIKSFMRPECVNSLLMSIRMKYDIKIIIVDDSENPLNFDYDDNIKTYNIEFDSGLSKGRNFGVSKIETPYFLLCDDDFEFTDNTDLVKWLSMFKNSDLDILGADVIVDGRRIEYFGLLEKNDNKLYYIDGFRRMKKDITKYDLILNFFIAKTNKIKRYPWDESLKLAEHTAFFFKYKGILKIGHTKLFSINHQRVKSIDYSKYRNRAKTFFKEWMIRYNISEVINFKGEKMKI